MAIQALESISAIQGLSRAFESLKGVSTSATNLVQSGMNRVNGVMTSVSNTVSSKFGSAMSSVNGIIGTVTGTVGNLREALGSKLGQALETVQPVIGLFSETIGKMPEKFGKFKEALSCTTEMKKLLSNVGVGILSVGIGKLISNWDDISDAARAFSVIGLTVVGVMTAIAKLSKGKLVASLVRGIAKLKAFTKAKFIAAKAAITKKSAMTFGLAVPAIVAGVVAGTAAIAAVARSSGSRTGGGGVSGVVSSASISGSGKAVAKSNTPQNIEYAVYNGYMAAVRDSGGQKSYVTVELDGREMAQAIAEPLRNEYVDRGEWHG